MGSIFISYRREDSQGEALHLCDDLKAQFGSSRVFLDVTGIEPGKDFRKAIEAAVITCDALIVMMGRKWIDAVDERGQRRLENPHDFVRVETAAALQRDVPVIPVVVQGASMPREDQLPPDLQPLVWRQAFELRHARWSADVADLVSGLRSTIPALTTGTSDASAAKPWWRGRVGVGALLALLVAMVMFAGMQSGMLAPEEPAASQPKFSLLGSWIGNSPCTLLIYKDDGKNIEGDCDVGGFRHKLKGRYLDANNLSMTITRTDQEKCSTTVSGTIQILDSNHVRTSQEGWDGCNVKTPGATTDLTRS